MEDVPPPPILRDYAQPDTTHFDSPENDLRIDAHVKINTVSPIVRDIAFNTINDYSVSSTLIPPTLEVNSPNTVDKLGVKGNDVQVSTILLGDNVSEKPTCSLNLVCYRSGAKGCVRVQIRVAKREYQEVARAGQSLIRTDREFFKALRNAYTNQMSGFWRRTLSLKQLSKVRLLSVS
jgi:hypothetical protein